VLNQQNTKAKGNTMINRQNTNQRMSAIVSHNNTIYLAGQVAEDANATIKEQTKSVLKRIDALLSQAGSSNKHILSATIYLRDIKDFSAMNEIWDAWVPEGHAPARACVEARLARAELLVEICIIAAKP